MAIVLSVLPSKKFSSSTSNAGGFSESSGTMRYTRERKMNSTIRDTRFQPKMNPQPTTLDARVMTCPTASGANMLVTWSIRRMVAFIPVAEGHWVGWYKLKTIKLIWVSLISFTQTQKLLFWWHTYRGTNTPHIKLYWQHWQRGFDRNRHLTSKVSTVVSSDDHNPVPLDSDGQGCAC